jgi:L-asparaginase II
MANPILVELTRGARLESVHRGAIAIARASGDLIAAVGEVERPIFPRSAVKPLQALPLIESGAADHYGLRAPEIAIACGSHAGTPEHVAVVARMLSRSGLEAAALACGIQAPLDEAASRELVRAGLAATALNHNCSGKHAGMLATAAHQREPIENYWWPEHPVQGRIVSLLQEMTGQGLTPDLCGIDGCSVPNWAIPLAGLATAFARFAGGEGVTGVRASACRRLAEACWAHPTLVAGRGRLDTEAMASLPGRVLLKTGAEGVYCGAFPELGLGFAVKIDDGGKRAAEVVAAGLLSRLCAGAPALGPPTSLSNFRGLSVGEIRHAAALEHLLAELG